MFTTVSARTHSESLLSLTIACFSKGTTEAKRFLTGKTNYPGSIVHQATFYDYLDCGTYLGPSTILFSL